VIAVSERIDNSLSNVCPIVWKPEDYKYVIKMGEGVRFVVPYPAGGSLYYKGQLKEVAFKVEPGDTIEFYPQFFPGEFTWQIEIREQGLSAIAKVNHLRAGYYTLPEVIPDDTTVRIEDVLIWCDAKPQGPYWDERKFWGDLQAYGIVYGIIPGIWDAIYQVKGEKEIVIAQGQPPTLPTPAQLINLIEENKPVVNDDERVDYFASKITLVQEGQVLARKVPGTPGLPGMNVRGVEIPAPRPKDFQFKLRKNVRISEDGLEVISTIAGLPIRMDEYAYGVEPVFILNNNLDLSVGSIEFPGDVYISGDVEDCLHVFAGGKVEIQGSASRAEIRAEKGLVIQRNVIAGKLVVGASFVVRSRLLRDLQALSDDLQSCLLVTADFINSPHGKNLRPGQCLKLIIERRFPNLPKKAGELEKFLLSTQDELIQQDLIVSVRTAKHFLTGLGPLDAQAIPMLERITKAFAKIIENIELDVPEKLECQVDYVQGAVVECGGSFYCRKGSYNSIIQAAGDVVIEGVCRGGKIIAGGNVEIKELGGSGVSKTTVQFPGSKRLKVRYCHANVIIVVDKEIITIDEPYKLLEIYRENGRTQIDKLKG
jgi:hypothetical protein